MDKLHFKTSQECKKFTTLIPHSKYNNFKTILKFAADKHDINKLIQIKNNCKFSQTTNLKKSNSQFNEKTIDAYYDKIDNLIFYRKQNKSSFNNTLFYLFYKIGCGIFVKIINNEIKMFFPFYNINYKNTWNLKFNNSESFDDYVKRKRPDDYNYDLKTWSMNGCLIHNWKKHNINDGRWAEYYDIIRTLCKYKKVNDVEFFINYKDFPSINRKLYEPNFFIYDNMNEKMKECKFKTYVPILSCYSSPIYADYLIPSYTEWKIITKKFYPNNSKFSCQNEQINVKKVKWKNKKPTAIFRGSATGCGITTETNQRLKIAMLSHHWKNNDRYNENNTIDQIPFLDAGITGYNYRDKKDFGNLIDIINIKKLNIPKVSYLSRNDQQQYKYIIYIDGHVAAERLIFELNSNSIILKVESLYNWIQWFHPMMKPFIHYIPVKKDLSDLADKILWCKLNDKKCYKITQNAKELFLKINNKEYILNYMNSILYRISQLKK